MVTTKGKGGKQIYTENGKYREIHHNVEVRRHQAVWYDQQEALSQIKTKLKEHQVCSRTSPETGQTQFSPYDRI